jgi:MFS family permease
MLCLSSLMFFASFSMLIPELPSYLTTLGGADYKGLIISLFTVTALISRPFSGKLADKIGRVPVVMFGSVVCLICSLIYPVVTTVMAFMALRLLHGFSTGFTPTGQAAYLSDIVPPERRGEAMGFLGTAGTMGMAGGPALGGLISIEFGINAMFYSSAFCAVIALVILSNIEETVLKKHRFTIGLLKIHKNDFLEPKVIVPSIVMVLCAYAYGAVYTVMPDFGGFLGIKNKGLVFTYLTVASFAIRLIAGKASDRYGRKPILLISSMVMCLSMLMVAFSESALFLIIGVTIYGLAQGSTSPTLLAWATDLSDITHKGRGVATLYIFMELGIGLGAFVSGLVYGNDSSNFLTTFIICSALAFIAFLYLLMQKKTPQPSI